MTKTKTPTKTPDYNPYGDPANPLYGRAPVGESVRRPPQLPVKSIPDFAPGYVLAEYCVTHEDAQPFNRLDIRADSTGEIDLFSNDGALRVALEVWRDGALHRAWVLGDAGRTAACELSGAVVEEGDTVKVVLTGRIVNGLAAATITPVRRIPAPELEIEFDANKEVDPESLARRA